MKPEDWKQLEYEVTKLLNFDAAKRPANSGGTKKEEDVIGKTTISQCKFTTFPNNNVHKKDIERLIDACRLQSKFPLFFTATNFHTLLSIPLNSETEDIVRKMLIVAVAWTALANLKNVVSEITDMDMLKMFEKRKNTVMDLMRRANKSLRELSQEIDNKLDIKRNSLLSYDLFDGGL